MPLPLLAIGAGLSLANSIGRWVGGNKQNKLADKINPVFNQYQASPYAKSRLGLANQLFNSRMAGASAMEKNIFSNQANYQGAVERTATDSSAALAAAAAGQGQTNQSLSDLLTAEKQNKYETLGNLNQAYEGMIREGDKEYDSMKYKFEQDMAQKNALREAGMQNKYGAVSDLSSLAIQLSGLNFGNGIKGVKGVKPLSQMGGGVTQRTAINRPEVGTQRPTPAFRPLAGTNYVMRRPAFNFSYNPNF